MGTLTIQFYGVCVHMTQFVPYRVFVPSGPIPGTGYSMPTTIEFPSGTEVPCLTPVIDGSDLYQLDRVAVFAGRANNLGQGKIDLGCTPHLSQIMPSLVVSNQVAFGRLDGEGSFFDLFSPAVTLMQPSDPTKKVAYAEAIVEYPGDEAVLHMHCGQDGTFSSITIADLPQTITVFNVPLPPASSLDAAEYLGNFLIAENYPADESSRLELEASIELALFAMVDCLGRSRASSGGLPLRPIRPARYDTFPSCSNSQWP